MNSVSQICTLTHTKSRCHTFRKCIWWWLDIGVWLWRISGCRGWANEVVIYQVNFENDHINFCGQHLPLIESLHIMASVVITRTRKNSCTMFYYVQLIKSPTVLMWFNVDVSQKMTFRGCFPKHGVLRSNKCSSWNYCLHFKCDVGNVIRINRSINPTDAVWYEYRWIICYCLFKL